MVSKLWLVVAFIALANPLPVQAQGGPPNSAVRVSPVLQQARQALEHNDFASAANYLRIAARHGDPMGQVGLGKLYLDGLGVPQNTAEGVRLMRIVIKRHQEPSYSLAVSALQGTTPSPSGNTRSAGMGDLAGLLHPHDLGIRADDSWDEVKAKMGNWYQRLTPGQKKLLIQLNRPVYTGVVVCTGSMCF